MILRKTVMVTIVSETKWPEEYDKGWSLSQAAQYEKNMPTNEQLENFVQDVGMSTKTPQVIVDVEAIV